MPKSSISRRKRNKPTTALVASSPRSVRKQNLYCPALDEEGQRSIYVSVEEVSWLVSAHRFRRVRSH